MFQCSSGHRRNFLFFSQLSERQYACDVYQLRCQHPQTSTSQKQWMCPFPFVSLVHFMLFSFLFSWAIYTWSILLSTYDDAFGYITLVCKNVLSNGPQTPIPDTSRQEFYASFPLASSCCQVAWAEVQFWRHYTLPASTSRSLIHLCLVITYPPFLHDRAWLMSFLTPHKKYLGVFGILQSYLKQILSWNFRLYSVGTLWLVRLLARIQIPFLE